MSGPSGGSADEVNRLLVAVQEWAQRAMPAPPSGHGGPECQWCPLCQLASALRGEHPELTDRLAEAGAAVSGAVRALLESASRSESSRPESSVPESSVSEPSVPPAAGPSAGTSPTGASEPPPTRPGPRPRIQRIRLDDTTPES